MPKARKQPKPRARVSRVFADPASPTTAKYAFSVYAGRRSTYFRGHREDDLTAERDAFVKGLKRRGFEVTE